MNKHYDKYLCRKSPREFCKVYTDTFGRKYVYVGVDKYFISKPYTSGNVEIFDLTPEKPPKRIIKQDVDFKAMFKNYGWVIIAIILFVFLPMIINKFLYIS